MQKFNKIARLFATASVMSLVVAMMVVPQASALVGSQFNAGRIIDDGVFFNGYTMDVAGIQAFLNAKVPSCDTNGSQIYSGSTTRAQYGASKGYPAPYTCLRNFTQTIDARAGDTYCGYVGGGTKSAAQIIYDVSIACSVSPKIILVLLQKEQSLVTDDWPWQKQYTSATGFACPDTAACDTTYAGFYNQVYYGAHQYQKYAKSSANYNYRAGRTSTIQYNPNPNAGCGGSSVYIQNQATAGLYNYTPYQPNPAALANLYGTGDGCSAYGNRNFWRLYNDWFGSTVSNGLPSSATVYLANPSGKIYVSIIDNGTSTNYYVPDWDTLVAFNLTNGPIVQVTDSYISSGGTPGTLKATYSPKGSGSIYLADQGRGFHIGSYQQCVDWNLPCGGAPEYPTDFTNWLANGGTLPAMFTNQNVAYRPVNGIKQPFARVDDIFNSGYTWNDFVNVQNINANLPLGPAVLAGPAAVKFLPDNTIYFYDGSSFHPVSSYDVLNAWGLGNAVIQPPTSSYNTTPPAAGSVLSTFVTDGANRYLVDGGQKILLSTAEQGLWPSATYQTLPAAALAILPTTHLTPFISSGGGVYTLDTTMAKKRHVPTYTDLIGLGYSSSNLMALSQAAMDQVTIGPDALGDGGLVSVQESGGVYIVSGGKLLHIPDWNTLSNYHVDLNNASTQHSTISSAYPYGADLTSTTKDGYGYYFYYNGTGYKVELSAATDLGVKPNSYIAVSPSVIVNSGLNHYASKFFVNKDDGRIYYGSGGGLHYVSSYQSLGAYGGFKQAIIPINTTILNSFTIGPDV